MKTLIIAEKPSVAKDIADSIGGDFQKLEGGTGFESAAVVVSSSIGHIAGLIVPEANGFPPLPIIPQSFQVAPLNEDSKKRLNMLKKLILRNDVDCVVNACDAGREGELIFYYLYAWIGSQKPVKRMWLKSMTRESIQEAYRSLKPAQEYLPLLNAARSRAEADWLVGINGSRAASNLQHKLLGGRQPMSVGRVQTPTLALIVNRENAIVRFIAKDYYEVHGVFQATQGQYQGKWKQGDGEGSKTSFESLEQAQLVVEQCQNAGQPIVTEETKPSASAPPKLFDLTTLQREANRKFGFTAKQTLDIAQALYEQHKVTSYPRTDSSALPEDYVSKAQEVLGKLQERYQPFITLTNVDAANKRVFNNAKISDHFAIIPTGAAPNNLSDVESKIYDLVVRRFISAFLPAAEFLNTKRVTSFNSGDHFITTGRVITNEGWQAVYGVEVDEEQSSPLCPIHNNESVQVINLATKAQKTKPPARFNEATLLGAMETAGKEIEDEELRSAMKEKGLGTPATRAPTIEGLIQKEYIARSGKQIIPTPKGSALIEFLNGNGVEHLTSPQMTGEWEHKLALIQSKGYERAQFMREVQSLTMGIVSTFQAKEQSIPQRDRESSPCPECGKPMHRYESKFKKGQFYWSCSGFKEGCKVSMDDANGKPTPKQAKAIASNEHLCSCGKPLIFRSGTSKNEAWKFWGCSGYPKCKNNYEDVNGVPVAKADLK